jgi:uncharacterized protein YbjT (DUF2867 family)
MNKTAVVFGATGLVGKELVALLLEDAEYSKVIAVTRKQLTGSNPKLEQIILKDFNGLMLLKDKLNAAAYFCCIGTTIKNAGSKEAFQQVDRDIPAKIAELAEMLTVSSLVVISSIGAYAGSSNFYLRTKGEMENIVGRTYKGNLKIVRPSLLMGDREEPRFGEKFATVFMLALGWVFVGPFKRYRGVKASAVAAKMIEIAGLPKGKVLYQSNELQK